MLRRLLVAASVAACLGAVSFGPAGWVRNSEVIAQEGHPLSGTWSGDWGTAATRTHVTVVLNWDGKAVTGTINPGPNAVPIAAVTMDVTKWTVHFEADSKTGHIVADGQLDDIGSYHRRITGTWTQGSTKGDFKLTRD
jgi:hypothetical protein